MFFNFGKKREVEEKVQVEEKISEPVLSTEEQIDILISQIKELADDLIEVKSNLIYAELNNIEDKHRENVNQVSNTTDGLSLVFYADKDVNTAKLTDLQKLYVKAQGYLKDVNNIRIKGNAYSKKINQ